MQLVFIPALLLALLAILALAIGRSWQAPGAFFSLMWTVFVLAPLVLAPDYYVWSGGVWWILVTALTVCLGSWTAAAVLRRKKRKYSTVAQDPEDTPVRRLNASELSKILVVFLGLGMIYSLFIIYLSSNSLAAFFSLDTFTQMAAGISRARYSGERTAPGYFGQIFLIFVFASPIMGGILFAVRRNRRQTVLSLLSVLPGLLIFAIQTTRFTFLAAFILWTAAYLAFRVFTRGGEKNIFSLKKSMVILIIVCLTVGLFVVGQSLRGGKELSRETLSEMLMAPGTRAATLGHLSVFTSWLQVSWDSQENASPAMGAFTLAGPFSLLGLSEREQGLYADEFHEVEPGGFTNIYTVLRGVIEDFTLPGSLVFFFAFGFLGGVAYQKAVNGDIRYTLILLVFYAFTFDYIASVFIFSSIFFAVVLTGFYIFSLRPRKRPGGKGVGGSMLAGVKR